MSSKKNVIIINNRSANNTINSLSSDRRGIWFRKRWELSRRIGHGHSTTYHLQRHLTNTSTIENGTLPNTRNIISLNNNRDLSRDLNVSQEGRISSRRQRQNTSTIIIDTSRYNRSNSRRRIAQGNNGRRINQIENQSVNNNKDKKLKEIEEEKRKEEKKKEEKKKEAIYIEENIGTEIKDTVKCYICFDKITKPKMCPHCHRIACEQCLKNWFINLKKTKCGFCRENTDIQHMISVPFMDAIVNFVDKYFNKNNDISNKNGDGELLEYCPEHPNEMLYYYCLDCGKAYCKTCFVFFGEEKDKHVRHSIIEYDKYKNMSFPLLKKNTDKLEKNIQHVEENIKRCLAYKSSYEHERKAGNKFIKNLQIQFNAKIDEIINIIDEKIKKLREYINEYNKYKKEVEDFYGLIKHKNNSDKSCESLIIKLTKINQHKFFSSKELDKLLDLSTNIYVNTYQSKVGEFNHENIFLSKGLKLGTSPYEIVIDNKKRNEVQISLLLPKEKTPVNHCFQSFFFIKKKGEGIKTYDLDEFKEDENFLYLKKKIPWNYFGQSIFKIKGVLYECNIS